METLVSLSIISLVAALAVVIFWQVSSPRSSGRDLLIAQQKTAEVVDKAAKSNDLAKLNGHIQSYQSLRLESSVKDIKPGLQQLVVEAYDNEGKLVYTRKRMFYEKPAQ